MFHTSAIAAYRALVAPRDELGRIVSGVAREDNEAMLMNIAVLERRLPTVVSFPADAQLALLWWAWANGAESKKFPQMFAQLKPTTGKILPNFDLAANEAFTQNEKLETKVAITAMFQNATDVLNQNLDITKLIWPRVLPAPLKKNINKTNMVTFGTNLAFATGAIWLLLGKLSGTKREVPLELEQANVTVVNSAQAAKQPLVAEFVDEPVSRSPSIAVMTGRTKSTLNAALRRQALAESELDVEVPRRAEYDDADNGDDQSPEGDET
jgi:hypothetical protein